MNKTAIGLLLAVTLLSGCGTSSTTTTSGPAYSSGSIYTTSLNTVSTIAGSPGVSGTTDGIGTAARFAIPNGAALSTDRTILYVTDYGGNTIRQIVLASNTVTTIAGIAGTSGSTNAVGTAATFSGPHDIATDGTSLYVTDTNNNTIRKIDIASRTVTTLAGKAGVTGTADGQGAAASFNGPVGITCSGTSLYVTDSNSNTIRQIDTTTGNVTTVAGSAGTSGSANGAGTAATFNAPAGITTDGTYLYVADFNNYMIRKIAISGWVVTTLAGSTAYYGSADGTGSNASFYHPNGITTDGTNLYLTDSGSSTIRKIVISTQAVTTVAGSPGVAGSSDGTGSAALFYFPVGITTDGTSIYVADADMDTIRKIQ